MGSAKPTHYDAPLKNPVRDSVLEYLHVGLSFAYAEPKLHPAAPPIKPTSEMSEETRRFLDRNNPFQEAHERALAAPIVEHLRRLCPDTAEDDPDFAAIVDMYRAAVRRALLASDPRYPFLDLPDVESVKFRLEIGRRVVLAVCQLNPGAPAKTTYDYLNEGPYQGGVTRHHIASAKAALYRWLKGRGRADQWLLLEQLANDANVVESLELLRQQAKLHPRFSRLRGEALAIAIHHNGNINEAIHRAGRILHHRRAA